MMNNNLNETKQLNKESKENAIASGNLSSVSNNITSEELNNYANIAMSSINDNTNIDISLNNNYSHLSKIQETNEKSSENKETDINIH